MCECGYVGVHVCMCECGYVGVCVSGYVGVYVEVMAIHTSQVPIILLQRMDLLLKKTSQEDVKKQIIPMILRAMEGGTSTSNTQLQVNGTRCQVEQSRWRGGEGGKGRGWGGRVGGGGGRVGGGG